MPTNDPQAPVLTIDGPTASGKGAVAESVASRLGWHYLDSGALYRLVALQAARCHVMLNDEQGLAELARELPVSFEKGQVFLHEEDVSQAIREPSVANAASRIAVFAPIREGLLARQHAFKQAPGLVADGRDMATVVFPDAPLKVFLNASVGVRAERRYKQLIEKGFSTKLTDLQKDIERRDQRDMNRKIAPLRACKDSHIIDSSLMDLESVIASVVKLAIDAGLVDAV